MLKNLKDKRQIKPIKSDFHFRASLQKVGSDSNYATIAICFSNKQQAWFLDIEHDDGLYSIYRHYNKEPVFIKDVNEARQYVIDFINKYNNLMLFS